MADATVKHAFVSAIPQGTDPTKIRTNDWNAALLFTGGSDGDVLTKSAASATGAAWSVPSTVAAAGTLTGNTLAANVLTSSLTSVGTLAGLTVTAPIAGSVTGAAGSAPAGALTGATLAANVLASSLTSVGTLTSLAVTGAITAATLTTTGNILGARLEAAAAQTIQWATRSRMFSPVDGKITIDNSTASAGVGFDFTTDATLKVLTRAMADTAIVNASRFSSGANQGVVTFGPAAVTSITVKGGLVVAIS